MHAKSVQRAGANPTDTWLFVMGEMLAFWTTEHPSLAKLMEVGRVIV